MFTSPDSFDGVSMPKKLMLLDFDGVISLEKHVPPENWVGRGKDSYKSNYQNTKSALIQYEGDHTGYVLYRPSVITRLNALVEAGLEIKWLTDRGEYASSLLAPALGLEGVTPQDVDAFDLGDFQQYDGRESVYWYKYQAMKREIVERNRQVLFVDDRIYGDIRHYMGSILDEGKASLIQTNALKGLTDRLMDRVEAWFNTGEVVMISRNES